MKKPKLTQAFTIIELLTVLVIIMIIAGLFTGVGRKARISAMGAKAKSMIAALEVAIGMYHADTGAYPDDTSNAALVSSMLTDPGGSVTGWRGPYMEFKREDYQDDEPTTGIIVDPWEKPYNYVNGPGWGNINSYNLWSNGPDTVDDSSDPDTDYDDDVYNW